MAIPRKYPEEWLEWGRRLVFESGRPIARVARLLFPICSSMTA